MSKITIFGAMKRERRAKRSPKLDRLYNNTDTFCIKYLPAYLFSKGFGYLLNLANIAAATLAVLFFFNTFSNNLYINWALTGFCLVLLEIVKRYFQFSFFRSVFSELGIKSVIFIAALVLSSFSVWLGFEGSKHIPETTRTTPTYNAPTLLSEADILKIEKQYDGLIYEAKKVSREFKKAKLWKGNLSKKNRAKHSELIAEVAKHKEAKINKLDWANNRNIKLVETAQTEHAQALQKFEQENTSTGIALGMVAIVLELLLMLCISFECYFDFAEHTELNLSRVATEVQPMDMEQTKIETTPTQQERKSKQEPHQAQEQYKPFSKPIGFQTKDNLAKNDNRKIEDKTAITNIINEGNRTCNQCGKAYISNHKKQKYCTDNCRAKAYREKSKKR